MRGPIDRRRALSLLGGACLGVLAAACRKRTAPTAASSPSSGSPAASAGSTATVAASPTATASGPTCTLTPEVTEGPYYINLNLIRSDITEGKAGTPLTVAFTVADATTCTPIGNAAVDIWHCDAGGIYSGFGAASAGGAPGPGGPGGQASPTDKLTFLRGIQMSDPAGRAAFRTVYPGWYRGRATHIHVKVHLGSNAVHTGQLFFPDDLTDTVYSASPYAAHGTRDTRNADDGIYQQAGAAAAIPAVASNGSGYVATITLEVKKA